MPLPPERGPLPPTVVPRAERADWPLPPEGLPAPSTPSGSSRPSSSRSGTTASGRAPSFASGSPAPGFGAATVASLRAEEARLARALANRRADPLVNGLHADRVFKRLPGSGSAFGDWLNRRLPLHGRRAEMKAILAAYNAKDPGLNARFFKTVDHAVKAASREMRPGDTLRGLVVSMDGGHALAADFRCHGDGGISLALVDSLRAGQGHIDEFARLSRVLEGPTNKDGRVNAVVLCATGAQMDNASCMGFAKDALTAFAREGEALDRLHAGARALLREGPQACLRDPSLGGLRRPDPRAPVLYAKEDGSHRLLPPAFYKNLQSTGLLASIGNDHPDFLARPVNRKGETLRGRLERLTGRPWVRPAEDGGLAPEPLTVSDKMVPMAENYRRMHRKAAEYGETGIPPGRAAP